MADFELESHETIDWKSVYLLPFKCTKITKLITFQFKLLHRRLAPNSFLKKIGVKESDLRTFCKTEAESLIHLSWSCGVTSIFWQEFKQRTKTNYENVTSNFSPATVLDFKPFFISKKSRRLCLIASRSHNRGLRPQARAISSIGVGPMIWDNFSIFISNCAIACGTRAYILGGFLRMSRRGNGVRDSPNLLSCFWPTTQHV